MQTPRLPLIFLLLGNLACPGKDTLDDSGPDPGSWTLLGEELPGALLSIWAPELGGGEDDVWTVGGDIGEGPLVLHLTGGAWTRVDTGSTGDLWWVWGTGSTVYMVGEGGRVLTRDPSTGAFSERVLAPSITLFGVWGSGPDDIWTVGGDINVASDGAVIWHYDGQSWTQQTLPEEAAVQVAIYKVWGQAADDVWAVGTSGVILHYDGSAWSTVSSPSDRNLFTVHGDGARLFAVGGAVGGTVLSWDGAAWSDVTPSLAPQFNGVYARSGCPAVAAGTQGYVFSDDGAGWVQDPRGSSTFRDLHAVRTDSACAAWAVGGSIASFPLDKGVLVYGGESSIPEISL